ncbi:hypothetical protein CXB51_028618 [Gossypium anomalum]|uniref:GAG-pre-integrase domain-containing protein n=1 Tax=Gossypium anomalum TaxID=47600 RepID=A0A8J5YF08_9ROSI|nr:hypothetical protein CXB51_028618 [Gossypium anomalum]
MASLKYEIPLLDCNTRFTLWQIKIQADMMKEKTAAALWKRLEQICMSKTLTSKLHMKQRLYAHHLEEGRSRVDSTLFVAPSYSTFRAIILYSRESLAVDEVYDSLTSYDKMKHLLVKPDSQGENLITRGRQYRNADNNRGKTQEQNPHSKSKGRSKSSNRGKTCNFCKKKGYIKSECYKLQNKIKREAANQKGKQPENSGEADIVEDYNDGELLVTSVNDSKVSEGWILDSGCTFHMSPNWDWFTTYETVSECVVLIGNNASCKIIGVGTIKVKMFDGVVRTLSDVRHVLELKRNLISLSTLDSKGYRYIVESGVLKIFKGFFIVMKGQRKTIKLYVLQGSTVTGDVAIASSSLSDDDITKLWHMCLGHMSENGMVELSKRGLLDGQGICKPCEHCVFRKQKRVRFTRGIHNTKGTLEYIHSDLWGPSRIVQVKRDRETLDSSSYSIAKRRCRTNEQNDHGEGSMCPTYAHVDNGKLEPRSIKCVFLGYKAGVKGYKLRCPENRKVVISRDVVFDETTMLPNLSLKDSFNKENQKQVEHQINTESTPQASIKIENRVTSSQQYSIAKNRTRREIKPLKKYAEADLVAYAFNVAKDIDANQDPSNYSKVISCED